MPSSGGPIATPADGSLLSADCLEDLLGDDDIATTEAFRDVRDVRSLVVGTLLLDRDAIVEV